MAGWFCEVGGTMRALRMIPPESSSYRWYRTPRGASETPNPVPARAESLRRRELTDLEGQAGERSQSMLVAQLMLCAGFLLFLVFPVVRLLGV